MFKKIIGSVVIGLGWILSPLTWWNDIFVNLPLAWFLSSLVTRNQRAFGYSMVFFYWLTNLAGFILMYFGWRIYSIKKPVTRKDIFVSFVFSLVYTAIILILIKTGILKPLL